MKIIPTVPRSIHRQRQGGSALIVALLLLLVITLLALSGARNTILQERMAGNMHDRNMAFQAAEAALRQAERNLASGGSIASIDPQTRPGSGDFWQQYFTTEGDPSAFVIVPLKDDEYALSNDPQYVIEELVAPPALVADEPSPAPVYRITARAEGGRSETVVILQTSYRR